MATIINFNKARKQKLKREAEQQAAANRVKFGRTPAEKERAAAEAEEARQRLEQLRRDPPEDD